MKFRKQHIGLAPGTLTYTGRATDERVKLTLIQFTETDYHEKDYYDLSECLNDLKSGYVQWINVDGLHNLELIQAIGTKFDIHNLTLEDIVHIDQRPKYEEYDNYVLSILKMMTIENHQIVSEQLSLVLFKEMVISFQEPHGGDAFDLIRERLRTSKGKIRKHYADYLFYAMLDAVVDFYFNVIELISDKIEAIEEEILRKPKKDSIVRLYQLKRELIFLRKQVWPIRDLVNNIYRSDTDFMSDHVQIFFRDLLDHSTRIIDTVETYRDLMSGLIDMHLSSSSNKMNEIMKFLTIISSLFIPVTFIAGVYGMNFRYMPELESPYGYVLVWVIIASIFIGQLVYFKKKKWL